MHHISFSSRAGIILQEGLITCLSVDSDLDNCLIYCSEDQSFRVWNLKPFGVFILKNFHNETYTLDGHSGTVNAASIVNNSNIAISGGVDNQLMVWDFRKRKELYRMSGHTDEITDLAVTNDGKYVISTSLDRSIRLWELKVKRMVSIIHLDSPISKLLLVDYDKKIILGDFWGNVHIFDIVK